VDGKESRAVTVRAARTFNPCPRCGRTLVGKKNLKEVHKMGVGVSLILVAAGAILTWAVTATVSGIDINTIGVILLVVGAIGLVLSLMFWSTWGGFGGGAHRRTTYVEDGPGPY
jgi:hypothetical protein